ncbi:MAG TPA: 30S ribosomal protein S12 methylthiotransferase RimO, partial [Tissierellia bacterium]|nr:30S ribosomal protein S12 methylthiotransferase RimO [Tissierellia bacterium]
MKRFYLENLGCSKNAGDGEAAIMSLVDRGYLWTQDPSTADILILNTCGFIEAAVQESLDRLFELADYKVEGHTKKLVMMGCLSQRYQEKLESELPEVDVFVGTGYLEEMADVLESEERFHFDKKDTVILSGKRPLLHLPSAYLKIAEGCDNRCTYCLIPSLRGAMRSRRVEDVVEEARSVLKQGAKELILIAQDVSRYGQDQGETLEELLIALNDLPGKFWIRLQYVYSDILTRSFFETMARCEKVVPYLDMPIQHVSDRVLRRMNRRTTKAQIEQVIDWAREIVPNMALRTTVMVGFPGETKEEFEELMTFLEDNPFERLGAFVYSDEEGAPS